MRFELAAKVYWSPGACFEDRGHLLVVPIEATTQAEGLVRAEQALVGIQKRGSNLSDFVLSSWTLRAC